MLLYPKWYNQCGNSRNAFIFTLVLLRIWLIKCGENYLLLWEKKFCVLAWHLSQISYWTITNFWNLSFSPYNCLVCLLFFVIAVWKPNIKQDNEGNGLLKFIRLCKCVQWLFSTSKRIQRIIRPMSLWLCARECNFWDSEHHHLLLWKPFTHTHKKHKLTPRGLIINDLEAIYGVLKYTLKHILLKENP